MSGKPSFNRDDIIKALLGHGIICKESLDGETHFYDEEGKEIFFPDNFTICWNIVDK